MFTRCIFIYKICFPPHNWGLPLTVNVFLQKTPVPNKVDLVQLCLLRIISALVTTESTNLRHESLIFFSILPHCLRDLFKDPCLEMTICTQHRHGE